MRKLLILLAILVSTTPLAAQWRRAGLFGADVRALIADPRDPDTLYLGTSSGEVYVSRDGAKSWVNPRYGTPFPDYVVDNLVLDREGRLWAASWGLWGGGVIAVSNDGGKSWERRDGGLENFSVRAIAVDPNDANFVVVGGLTGVYRSRDGGRKWEQISDQINVESLAVDPRTNDRIFIGTWRQGWRTDDGGRSWKHVAEGMVLDTDMFHITIDPSQPDNVWVATCGWVYNSQNGGDNWTRYRDGFNNRRIHDVDIDPCDKDVVYAGSVAGLYRSEDKGKSWYVLTDEGLVINSIVLHPQRPQRIILGIEGDGVYVSNDRGKSFKRTSDGLHNLRIKNIVPDPFQKNRIYASVVFGGAASGIYRSNDAGKTWEKASRTALPEVMSLVVASEADADVKFLAGTEKGFFWSNDGEEWTQAAPSDFPIRVDKVLRFNRTRGFAATAEGVFTTRDGGKNWYRLAGATNRAIDMAIGSLNGSKALYALTAGGLEVFDGTKWMTVEGAPAKGRTIAIRSIGGTDNVFIAGSHGVYAGTLDEKGKWQAADAPNAQFASVHGGSRSSGQLLFLTSREQREILIADSTDAQWSEITLPARNTEITSVVPDPFTPERYFVGTLGEGIFVYEGKTGRYVAREKATQALATPGSK
ncbi:MAG: YCF48-related protein [Acidobacteriota bacterium]|nr:YCF48-related protein [Acidobacteriota bacterium]